MDKLRVGVLGATGMVGQKYVSLLENHPWFEVAYVAASERSAGRRYADSVNGRWYMKKGVPKGVAGIRVENAADVARAKGCDFVFSALESDAAKGLEHKYAEAGIPVVSNASAHRGTPDVPMLIPEINPEHCDIIPIQKRNRGWTGFIAVKPNCSLQSYMAPLFALNEFGLKKVIVTTMQAVSGAGAPSIAALDMEDNIIPFIKGEEEKSEREPLKILGKIKGGQIANAAEPKITAHCNRVPTTDGHMATVSVEFKKRPEREEILELWEKFKGEPQRLKLPSAPERPIIYRTEEDRPQTRLDRDNDKGMAVTVGRLRECNVLQWRFVGLSHNTVRGAAGGGILNAELLKAKGYF